MSTPSAKTGTRRTIDRAKNGTKTTATQLIMARTIGQALREFRFSAEFEKVVMAFALAPWIVYWSERTLTIAQLQTR